MTTLFLETNRISIPDAFMIPRLLIVKRKGIAAPVGAGGGWWNSALASCLWGQNTPCLHSERTKLLPNPPHGSVLDSVGGVGFWEAPAEDLSAQFRGVLKKKLTWFWNRVASRSKGDSSQISLFLKRNNGATHTYFEKSLRWSWQREQSSILCADEKENCGATACSLAMSKKAEGWS